MPLTNDEAADLIGGILLDAAKELNEKACPKDHSLVAITTALGTQIIQVPDERDIDEYLDELEEKT